MALFYYISLLYTILFIQFIKEFINLLSSCQDLHKYLWFMNSLLNSVMIHLTRQQPDFYLTIGKYLLLWYTIHLARHKCMYDTFGATYGCLTSFRYTDSGGYRSSTGCILWRYSAHSCIHLHETVRRNTSFTHTCTLTISESYYNSSHVWLILHMKHLLKKYDICTNHLTSSHWQVYILATSNTLPLHFNSFSFDIILSILEIYFSGREINTIGNVKINKLNSQTVYNYQTVRLFQWMQVNGLKEQHFLRR